jgi:glyoxylase-like metal-dependent hydrolase (beta-lactamase superfamily II)
MTNVIITRRNAILGATAGVIAATAPVAIDPAHAKAELKGVDIPVHARYKLGDFDVTTLLAGQRTFPGDPQETFAMNVDKAEFEKVTKEHFLPTDVAKFYFTPTIVNTGNELVLFDAGLGGETPGILMALQSAGYSADQIDVVVITHMHPDHIGGLMTGGKPTFPNARYVTGSKEYDFWSPKGADNRIGKLMISNVKPLAEKMTFVKEGDAVVSGITAIEAHGHTPGHMCYRIESNGQQVLLLADLANHYVWSLAYPDWEVRFDADKSAAAAARRKLLGMAAADRLPIIGYHLPFPALGYVESRGNGFHYVPASYQLQL